MARALFLLSIVAVVLFVAAVVDCAFIERRRIRALGRAWWLVIIVLLPVVGAILWLVLGRSWGRRDTGGGGGPRPLAPDDDPDFLRRIDRDAVADGRIARLEDELRRLDQDGTTGPPNQSPTQRKQGDMPGNSPQHE